MREELREKIIAYNKRRRVEKEAYEDFLMMIKMLKSIEKILPEKIVQLLKKYEG